MRKILLSTTALAAAAMMAAPASAHIDVTLGGYNEFFFGIYDDDTANRTSHEFQNEAEIVVRADGRADNGLEYGAKLELNSRTVNTENNFGDGGTFVVWDEASVYLGGTWGRVEMGDFDGASDALAVFYPSIGGIDQHDGDYEDFFNVGGTTNLVPAGTLRAPDTQDGTKVMYMTPRFNGFQAAVSYAPQADGGINVVPADTSPATFSRTEYEDWFTGGLHYENEWDGFTFEIAVTGVTADARDAGGVQNVQDFFAWQAGARIGYAGFELGGGYVDSDDYLLLAAGDPSADQESWNIGLSYEQGPWAVGASYVNTEGYVERRALGSATPYVEDHDSFAFGAHYTVAPGLVVAGDLVFFDQERKASAAAAATTNNDGYVGILSTRVNF